MQISYVHAAYRLAALVVTANILLVATDALQAQSQPVSKTWPAEVKDITYPSPIDDSKQPAKFYAPTTKKPAPLLVGLHVWSSDYKDSFGIPYGHWAVEKGWNFIHPNFRGPNNRPEAGGSELVVADILAAVDYAKTNANVDSKRIYLVGVSGGGYASLLMAGRHPEVWTAVSAWVPVTDLEAWHGETKSRNLHYYQDVEKICGGTPEEKKEEYAKRSPLTYLASAKGKLPIDINAGINDGYEGQSVPTSHSLHAFNKLAEPDDQVSAAEISAITEQRKVPAGPQRELGIYNGHKILFRRESGPARVTIFDGGHEILYQSALEWLSKQTK